MSRSYWYDKATTVINGVLDGLDLATASKRAIEDAVGAACPFGGQAWAYKQWLAARKHVLRVRCPRLFSVALDRGVDREAAAGLFAPAQLSVDPDPRLSAHVHEQPNADQCDRQ